MSIESPTNAASVSPKGASPKRGLLLDGQCYAAVGQEDASVTSSPRKGVITAASGEPLSPRGSGADIGRRRPIENPRSPCRICRIGLGLAFPALLAALGFYLQSVQLHYATYLYVRDMDALRNSISADSWRSLQRHYGVALRDPVAEALGPKRRIDISLLDSVASVFPFAFLLMCMAFPSRSLRVWTKVMFCLFPLFTMKGMLATMTVVPDSNGFEACSARLGDEGLAWMRQHHSYFPDMFVVDYLWQDTYSQQLRYCADMMYSGHTFVVTLFAIGCYDIASSLSAPAKWGRAHDPGSFVLPKMAVLLILLLAIFEQSAEIYLVLKSRFHYTSDVFLALVITLLMYSNGLVSVLAARWEMWAIGRQIDECSYEDTERELPRLALGDDEIWTDELPLVSQGDFLMPSCFPPSAGSSNRYHLMSDRRLETIGKKYEDLQKHARRASAQARTAANNLANLLAEQRMQHTHEDEEPVVRQQTV